MTLGYFARAVVQMAIAHLLVSTVAALAVAWAWRAVAASAASPASRSRRLFALRLLPSLAGLAAASLVGVAYLLWERRVDTERVGPVALVVAAAGLGLIAAGAARALVSLRRTEVIRRALLRSARAFTPRLPIESYSIESPFPIVALVGLIVPRLFVARTVVEACTPDEFAAVVSHEMGHARERDNLRRLGLAAAPDVLGIMPVARRMHDDWAAAAELAADEWAATTAGDGLSLASALVKVARIATSQSAPLTASALYDGRPIAARVERLVNPPAAAVRSTLPAWTRLAAVTVVVAVSLASLPLLHEFAELLLRIGVTSSPR
jgi:beta-lactamase regulating signal transducer with metallopeptidase domain